MSNVELVDQRPTNIHKQTPVAVRVDGSRFKSKNQQTGAALKSALTTVFSRNNQTAVTPPSPLPPNNLLCQLRVAKAILIQIKGKPNEPNEYDDKTESKHLSVLIILSLRLSAFPQRHRVECVLYTTTGTYTFFGQLVPRLDDVQYTVISVRVCVGGDY